MRVVSLVPSLTEAIMESDPTILVGCTQWCTHPPQLLDASAEWPSRIGGTKNPDVTGIIELRPDLVVASAEENRVDDLDALRAAGLNVLVTDIRCVPEAFVQLAAMLDQCGLSRPGWLTAAETTWRRLPTRRRRVVAVVPIWRRPWMALGSDTFAGDVLARLGVDNALAGHPQRYPRLDIDDLPRAATVVVLPDEPYRFTANDGPEAFPDLTPVLVDGRLLTWYGPSLAEAADVLGSALRGVLSE